ANSHTTRAGGADRGRHTSMSLQAAAVGDAMDRWCGVVMALIHH
ncbi:hypothetical protein C5S42_05760, partial [Candidatus Methanomarinus sp.]